MESKFKKPAHLVAFGVFLLALGGFFTLVHVGMSGLKHDTGIKAGFGSRAEPAARPGYTAAIVRGGEIVADKAGDFISEFFSAGESKSEAGQSYADARGGEGAGESGRDPFEEFYERNYSGGANAPGSDGYSASSGGAWGDSGGTAASASSGSTYQAPAAVSRAGGAKAAAGAKAQAGAVPGNPLFGGPLGKTASQPSKLQLQASLPAGGGAGKALERPGEMSGGQFSRGPAQAAGGALSGMRGQAAPGDLNGADEAASASSKSSYNSKMSGGASAAAAAGGSAPAASAAEKVSAGGGASGGSGDSSAGGDAKTGDDKTGDDKTGDDKTKSSPAGDFSFNQADDSEENQPFLAAVVIEKRSGKDSRYITAEDKKGELDEGQLKAGAIPVEAPAADTTGEKGFRSSQERKVREPDPEDFTALTEKRKTELKRRIHGFMKRIETQYGEMDDITYTSCDAGKEICAQHQLTEGYLTLNTKDEAELLLGLKYVETRWRRYTVGFSLPGWGRPHRPHSERP